MPMKVLVTCPPMLGMMHEFHDYFSRKSIEVYCPDVVQTLSEAELINLVPQYDGWIIGDDPATRAVFKAGAEGKLKAAVKWGIGIDNVDFDACKEFNIPITNTPNMFGGEVADIAMGYVIALARETFEIDRGVRAGEWPKPRGISLAGKTVALVGFGDIGKAAARRFLAADMHVIAYDPSVTQKSGLGVVHASWPERIDEADFIVVTCALTSSSFHMLNANVFEKVKPGVRIVNVGRGPVIYEEDLISALLSGKIYSAALDVFEEEPLPIRSALREHPHCIFGSHNSSNTSDSVERTSQIAINKLFDFLGISA
jgi:D-3-phosphoglycerate dehydrogenase / 2-oxoglutarate reductase